MIEHAVTFGSEHRLAGIVTEPRDAGAGGRRAVLMSNVGMLNRIGPFRLYVELARTMSADGWWALRFDEAGIGDSASGVDAVALPGDDVVRAMDFLHETQGITQFVLLGLCSGVDSMHAAAVRDSRVSGAVFIDGYTYPTLPYYLRRALRVFDTDRWKRYLRGRVERLRAPRPRGQGVTVFDRVYPPRAQFVRDIAVLTQRDVRAFFVYTATVDRDYNAPRQLFEILGPAADTTRITAVQSSGSDHLFTRSRARAALIDQIRHWAATLV